MSEMSFSDSAGTEMFTFGSDRPLLLDTAPPSTTRHSTSVSSAPRTSSASLPSSTRRRSPLVTSPGSFL
jgi:hypothetical protein